MRPTPGDGGRHDWRAHRLTWLIYLLTLLSAIPLATIWAQVDPCDPGQTSGIGFGATLCGSDLATFALLLFGLPYAAGLAVLLGLLSLVPSRLGWIPLGASVIGLAVPWGVTAWVLAETQLP